MEENDNEKCEPQAPAMQGAGAYTNSCNTGQTLGGSIGPSYSEIVRKLRERRERLTAERRKINEQIEALTEKPTKMSMDDVLQIVEQSSRPLTIY